MNDSNLIISEQLWWRNILQVLLFALLVSHLRLQTNTVSRGHRGIRTCTAGNDTDKSDTVIFDFYNEIPTLETLPADVTDAQRFDWIISTGVLII